MVITSLKIAKGISEQISGKWWRARVNNRDFSRKEEVILCLQYSEDDMRPSAGGITALIGTLNFAAEIG